MIQRHKPIARSTKPLKRTPLKRVSKKRAKENRTYMKLREEFLANHPYCEAFHVIFGPRISMSATPASTEVHHKIDRRAHFLDVSSWLAVSRLSHLWIHANPGQARKLGLLQ